LGDSIGNKRHSHGFLAVIAAIGGGWGAGYQHPPVRTVAISRDKQDWDDGIGGAPKIYCEVYLFLGVFSSYSTGNKISIHL